MIQNKPLSAFLTQNTECLFSVHIPNLSLIDEKFESCMQGKFYKPYNQGKNFFIACLSKTMIVSDITDFLKAISCPETTHVSTKQRLVVIIKKNLSNINITS